MGRPRGRPRQYDPELALEAAMSVFWERGFSATSLTDLCEAMGMNRPSLYAAFGDKRSIYIKALGRFEQHMRETAAQPLAKQDLGRALSEFYFAMIDVYLSGEHGHRGCMFVSTATVAAVADEEIRERLDRTIGRLDAVLGARMRQAAEAGLFTQEDAAARAGLATAVLHSLSVRARAGHTRRTLRKFARESVKLLTGGAGPAAQ